MTVNVRYENADWPLFRVLYADTFGATGAGPWTIAPYVAPGVNGVWFKSCVLQALPGIGEAEFIMEFGLIDGSTVTPLDLLGKHIRIQAARQPIDDSTPAWRTIWLGRVAWQDDTLSPGASIQRGTRLYRCQDLLYSYLSNYPMDRHAHYGNTATLSYGHPGYNWNRDTPGQLVGNREASGSGFTPPDVATIVNPESKLILNFTIDDASVSGGYTTTTWTEAQSLQNAMDLRRNSGDPVFAVDAYPTNLLSSVSPWEVKRGDMAWDVVNAICNRRRGKGLAFLGWDDDQSAPTGAISIYLRVRPQLASDLTYTDPTPGGGSVTLSGATATTGNYVSVDLQSDQRNVDSAFQIRDYGDSTVDELTTEGERILVGVTVSGYDSTLANRWTANQETLWNADQGNIIYRNVLRRFGLKRVSFGQNFKNGDNAEDQRADYWTDASGYITNSHNSVTPPEAMEVEDTIPFWEGYDYTTVVDGVPADNPSSTTRTPRDGSPPPREPLVLIRTTTNRFILPEQYNDGGYKLNIDGDGLTMAFNDDSDGSRCIRGTYPGVSTRTITEASLTFTLGIRMPQRVRFTSSISGTVRRRKTLTLPGHELWISHPGCIWGLDETAATLTADGKNARRAGGSHIGRSGATEVKGRIFKDDRAAMARAHYLAWEWYRSDTSRYAVQYAIKDCGLLYTWTDLSGTAVKFARLGQMLTSLKAAGTTYAPNTPVTRVEYSNETGVTTWHTDWQELDYGTA